MTSETSEQAVKTEGAGAADGGPAAGNGGWKCPLSDPHIHREDVRKVWKECQEESFWYRALPFSLGSMAVTGGLIYNGVWKPSKRFGPFPKLAVAGLLGTHESLEPGLIEDAAIRVTEPATTCVKSVKGKLRMLLQRRFEVKSLIRRSQKMLPTCCLVQPDFKHFYQLNNMNSPKFSLVVFHIATILH
ncbi:hypothetical protein OJAV_G00035240 [Oryzias javanicus]|uniref:OCIA domain-containing protein n=1 Tax=Oryzias javanicus TaxID=123683 RepID=A0A3S2PEV7_ORYJA|nr:hypothetical protein OJAV_G00035240 [Oryzias javanicus]